jgi:hypothetical protein
VIALLDLLTWAACTQLGWAQAPPLPRVDAIAAAQASKGGPAWPSCYCHRPVAHFVEVTAPWDRGAAVALLGSLELIGLTY